MKVRFLTLAQQELDDAVAWYNEQVAGWAMTFSMKWTALFDGWLLSLCARKLNRVCDDACWPDSLTD